MSLYRQKQVFIIFISILFILGSITITEARSKEEIYQAKLSRLKTDDVKGHYQLGLWCKQNRLPEQAKTQFEKVIGLNPNHAGARTKLGYIRYEGKWVTREEKYKSIYEEKLAKLKDDDVSGHYQLGLWCQQHKLSEQATTQFEKVIKLDPDHSGARRKLNYVKYKEKWIKSEEKPKIIYGEKLADIKDDDVKGHYELGLWCKNNGLFDEAQIEFENVLRLDPSHRSARKHLDGVASTIRKKLVAEYVAANEAARKQIRQKIRVQDKIDATEVQKWIGFVRTHLRRKDKHDGKQISVVNYREHTMKSRLLGNIKGNKMKYRLLGNTKGNNLSLLVMLHGGGTPEVNDKAWQHMINMAEVMKPEYDLIAIPRVWWDVCAAWGSRGGTALVVEMINQIKRTYSVDTNRIYLFGTSMGGYGVSCIGSSESDYFAALGLHMAACDYHGSAQNLMHTPTTVHIGASDTVTDRIGKARKLRTLLEEFQKQYPGCYKLTFKEYPGKRHDLPNSTTIEALEWMRRFKRDPLPRTVVWKGFLNAARKVPEKHYFYWLGVEELTAEMRLEAQIQDKNRILIKTKGVREFTVFLNDKLVDLNQPVIVEVDGEVKYNSKVPLSLTAILESLVAKEDLEMVFTARVDISMR